MIEIKNEEYKQMKIREKKFKDASELFFESVVTEKKLSMNHKNMVNVEQQITLRLEEKPNTSIASAVEYAMANELVNLFCMSTALTEIMIYLEPRTKTDRHAILDTYMEAVQKLEQRVARCSLV